MQFHKEDDNRIKGFLLGAMTEEEAEQIEERIFDDPNFAQQLRIIADELMDDYASEQLTADERRRFEQYFLARHQLPDEIRQKARRANAQREHWLLMKAIKKYAADANKSSYADAPVNTFGLLSQARLWFSSWWQVPAFLAVLVVVGFLGWRFFFYQSETDKGLALLSSAYANQRPLEARITGFAYAPFVTTRGNEAGTGDYRALDDAETLLRNAARARADAAALYGLGKFYLVKREWNRAIDHFQQAAQSDPHNAQLHNDWGVALMEKGNAEPDDTAGKSEMLLTQGLEEFSKALELSDSLLAARFNRALLYQKLNLHRQAEAEWERYLSQDAQSAWAVEARRHLRVLQELKKKVAQKPQQLEADFWAAYQQNDAARAWEVFSLGFTRTGNTISGKLLDNFLEQACAGKKAEAEHQLHALFFIGRLAQQQTNERQMLEQAHFYGTRKAPQLTVLKKARELMVQAYRTHRESNNDSAITYYQQARDGFQTTGDAIGVLLADYGIAYCRFQQSELELSRQGFAQLAQVSQARNYFWIKMMALHGLSMIHETRGNYSDAIAGCREINELAAQQHDENSALRSRNLLAGIYRTLGQHQEALQVVQPALTLAARVTADESHVVGFYMTGAWSLSALGQHRAALSYEKESIELCETMQNPFTTARGYTQLGMIQAKLKNYNEAIQAASRALAVGQSLSSEKQSREVSSYAQASLGHFLREAGRLDESVVAFQKAINFFQENDEQLLLYGARKGLFLTQVARLDIQAAEQEIERVFSSFEKHREKILEESSRNSFFDQEQNTCDLAIAFAQEKLADSARAFVYAERCRSRSLLDLTTAHGELVTAGASADLRFAATVTPPLPLEEIRWRLPTQTQLVQFAVLPEKTLVWLVTREAFTERVLPAGSARLNDLIPVYLQQLSHPAASSDEKLMAQAKALHDLLIAPLLPELSRNKTLCLIPDKKLMLLPFAALFSRASGKWLIEEFTLLYAPSATMFLHCTEIAEQRAGKTAERLLSVGNPAFDRRAFPALADLPSAAQEATQIAAFYPKALLLTGAQATETEIRQSLPTVDVAHFAVHHVADDRSALFSRMLFARGEAADVKQDGFWEAREILQQKLPHTRLVILSACQTRAEKYYQGEGLIGLSRCFLAATVPLTIASLWDVDSNATAKLMVAFHRQRQTTTDNSAAALRHAQLSLLQGAEAPFRHPYYWAAFVATGGYTRF